MNHNKIEYILKIKKNMTKLISFFIFKPFYFCCSICLIFIFMIFNREHNFHYDCLYCSNIYNNNQLKIENVDIQKGCCKKCKLYKKDYNMV